MSDFDDLLGPDTRSEHAILNDVLVGVTALSDTVAYRQNTGTAWQGRPVDVPPGEYVRVTPGMKILAEARPIEFGFPGAGDVVGQRRGKAFQIETKTATGSQRTTQETFERLWTKRGGIYILARDVDQCLTRLRKVTD